MLKLLARTTAGAAALAVPIAFAAPAANAAETPSAPERGVQSGQLVNASDPSMCLTMVDPEQEGVPGTAMAPCLSEEASAVQDWTMTKAGEITVTASEGAACLTAAPELKPKGANGVPAVVLPCSDELTQVWETSKDASGELVNKGTGQTLDIAGDLKPGDGVMTTSQAQQPAQWKVTDTSSLDTPPDVTGMVLSLVQGGTPVDGLDLDAVTALLEQLPAGTDVPQLPADKAATYGVDAESIGSGLEGMPELPELPDTPLPLPGADKLPLDVPQLPMFKTSQRPEDQTSPLPELPEVPELPLPAQDSAKGQTAQSSAGLPDTPEVPELPLPLPLPGTPLGASVES